MKESEKVVKKNSKLKSKSNNVFAYKKFRSDKSYYIYDSMANCIIKVDEIIFDILNYSNLDGNDIIKILISKFSKEKILSSLNKIQNFRKKEKIFNKLPIDFEKFDYNINFDKTLSNHLNHLQLNITENCNFRCKYCVYNGKFNGKRIHSIRAMSFGTAKKSIDYFMKHCIDKPFVSFYGGEPLLHINLIKQIVEYIKKNYNEKKCEFLITSNGSLLSPAIIKFLISNSIKINISIDGPENIHDKYRIFKNNKKSHSLIIKNITKIKEMNENYYKSNVGFLITYNINDSLNDILNFFNNDLFKIKNPIKLNFLDLPEEKNLEIDTNVNPLNKETYNNLWNKLKNFLINSNNDDILPPILNISMNCFIPNILKIHRRLSKLKLPYKNIHPNGCCIPGVTRLFVSVEGSFYICEKFGKNSFQIGDIDDGLNKKKIKKIINKYSKISIKSCKNCWAVHLCGLCFLSAYNFSTNKLDIKIKDINCNNERKRIIKSMEKYIMLMEKNSHVFERFNYD